MKLSELLDEAWLKVTKKQPPGETNRQTTGKRTGKNAQASLKLSSHPASLESSGDQISSQSSGDPAITREEPSLDLVSKPLILGNGAIEISSVTEDSRCVTPGALFIACPGRAFDGKKFIPEAMRRGASAICTELPYASRVWNPPFDASYGLSLEQRVTEHSAEPSTSTSPDSSMSIVSSSNNCQQIANVYTEESTHAPSQQEFPASPTLDQPLSPSRSPSNLQAQIIYPTPFRLVSALASSFYQDPSKQLEVIAVTGTNGKTSVTWFLQQLSHSLSPRIRCARLGTLGNDLCGALEPSKLTTPSATEIHRLLSKALDHRAQRCVLEASSQGLDQERLNCVEIDGAIFTNFTQDHLDYHGTEQDYFRAKTRLFQQLEISSKSDKLAVGFYDDRGVRNYLHAWSEHSGIPSITYGFDAQADLHLHNPIFTPEETRCVCRYRGEEAMLTTTLPGHFNLLNIAAAITYYLGQGTALRSLCQGAKHLQAVPGRMEEISGSLLRPVIIDYGHTPDALEQALAAVRESYGTAYQLITLFGCGGNRDRSKRPLMGAIAARLSDRVIITNDNPRSEEPSAIAKEIAEGIRQLSTPSQIILNRKEAIEHALTTQGERQIVLIAGKGHETEQVTGDETLHFSDREVATAWLREHR